MSKVINLRNKKFGRLTVISYDHYSKGTGHAVWYCKCKCGTIKRVRASHLKDGNVRSCGCLSREISSSPRKRKLMSKIQKGSNNSNWKSSSKYSTIHDWLRANWPKVRCWDCGAKTKLDFALKKGKKHARNRFNYFVLCRSCHIKYDKS